MKNKNLFLSKFHATNGGKCCCLERPRSEWRMLLANKFITWPSASRSVWRVAKIRSSPELLWPKVNVTGGGSHSQRQTGAGTLGNTRPCSVTRSSEFWASWAHAMQRLLALAGAVYYYYIAHVSLALFECGFGSSPTWRGGPIKTCYYYDFTIHTTQTRSWN